MTALRRTRTPEGSLSTKETPNEQVPSSIVQAADIPVDNGLAWSLLQPLLHWRRTYPRVLSC
jgi:hypothetical protein